jgi:hypothetical protein
MSRAFFIFLETNGGKGLKRIGGMKGGSQSQFNTRTLHQIREGMRHPRASERIEGQPPARFGTRTWDVPVRSNVLLPRMFSPESEALLGTA